MRRKLTMQKKMCPVCRTKTMIIAGKFCTHGKGFQFCSGSGSPATPTQETPLEKCAQCGKLTEETWSCSDGVNESIRVCADCRGER